MSWRKSSSLQPARKTPQTTSMIQRVNEALIFIAHLGHEFSANTFQKLGCTGQVKLVVARFDADKEAVVRCFLKAWHGKERAMRLRQLVQGKHAKHRKSRGAQHCQFECNGNERWPTVQRAAGDVQRVCEYVHPILKEETGKTTPKAAEQGQLRNKVVFPAF